MPAAPQKKLNSEPDRMFTFPKASAAREHLKSHREVDLDDLVALVKNPENSLAHLEP